MNKEIRKYESQFDEEYELEARRLGRFYPDMREISPFLEKEEFLFNLQGSDKPPSPAMQAAIDAFERCITKEKK